MKKTMLNILGSIVIFCFLGLFLFVGLLFATLIGCPPYLLYALYVVGPALLVCIAVCATGLLKGKWCRRVWAAFGALALCAAGYVGYGWWEDSLPTVDDRQLLIQQYVPFAPDTKALYLEEASTLQLTASDILSLRLDGATALYPVYSAFVQATFPEGDYPLYTSSGWYGRVACTGTIEAYQRLMDGEADMIFAAAPSQAQLDAAEAAGMELHLTPIGKEAFVFFVNSKNPVTSLTVEQIQGIYTGEITIWKELGGKRQSIRAYQRAENSGSQSALLRLMDGLPLMEPKTEDRIGGMGGIITEVARYRNHRNAIGFSFRYYATEMVSNDQIRLLALNGVEPTKETIRDGSYPISSYFYAVTAAPRGQSAPEDTDLVLRTFLDWVLSEQGQELVERTGYVSLG